MTTILKAHELALEAANAAVAKFQVENGTEREGRMGACGFAWAKVDIDGRKKVAKELKAVGFTSDWNYGISLWNPSKYPGQNVDDKEIGCNAYVRVMKEHLNIVIYSQSRLD